MSDGVPEARGTRHFRNVVDKLQGENKEFTSRFGKMGVTGDLEGSCSCRSMETNAWSNWVEKTLVVKEVEAVSMDQASHVQICRLYTAQLRVALNVHHDVKATYWSRPATQP